MQTPETSVWRRERMAAVDAAWLRLDALHGPSAITALLFFDTVVDRAAIVTALQQRLLPRAPRFSQRVVHSGDAYWWEDAPAFCLGDHVVRHRLRPAKGRTTIDLESWVNQCAALALDPERPLWRMDLVTHDDAAHGKRSVLMVRVHHCVADGLALMEVLRSLAESPSSPLHATSAATPTDEAPDWARHVGDLMAAALAEPRTWMERSREMAEWATEAWARHRQHHNGTVRLQAGRLVAADAPPPQGAPPRVRHWCWTATRSREELHAVAAALGVGLQTLVLGALAHALSQYLEKQGESVEGLQLEALVPVSLRARHPIRRARPSLGNHIGWVPVALPLGEANPLATTDAIHRQWGMVRTSPLARWSWSAMGWLGHLPLTLQQGVLDHWAGAASLVCTQVPGPRQPVTLAGHVVEDLVFWVPQAGPIGLGVSISTYADHLRVGLVADVATLPGLDEVSRGLEAALEAMLWSVLLVPEEIWGDAQAMAQAVAQAPAAPKARTPHPHPPPSSGTRPARVRRGTARPGSLPDTPPG